MQRGIAVLHALLEVCVCPEIEGALLDAGLSGVIGIVYHTSVNVGVTVHGASYWVGSYADAADEVSILFLGRRAYGDALVGEIGSEVSEGALPHAEIGHIVRICYHAYQWSCCVCYAVRLASLSQVFGP